MLQRTAKHGHSNQTRQQCSLPPGFFESLRSSLGTTLTDCCITHLCR